MLEQVRAAAATAGRGRTLSLSEAFNGLDATWRRPVGIVGLLQLTTPSEGVDPFHRVERFGTIRPDATRRTFSVPHLLLHAHHLAAPGNGRADE